MTHLMQTKVNFLKIIKKLMDEYVVPNKKGLIWIHDFVGQNGKGPCWVSYYTNAFWFVV